MEYPLILSVGISHKSPPHFSKQYLLSSFPTLRCQAASVDQNKFLAMATDIQQLIQFLEQILQPRDHHKVDWLLHPRDKPHIESLLEKSCYLESSLETSISVTGHDVQILEDQINDTANRAKNAIASHLVVRSRSNKIGRRFRVLYLNLLQKNKIPGIGSLLREFDQLVQEMKNMSTASSINLDLPNKILKNPAQNFVGLSEDVDELKHLLMIEGQSNIVIIPIVGMYGIGKTTLARTLYNDPSVVSHFDHVSWVTVTDEMMSGFGENILANLHSRFLPGRRLIVIDNISRRSFKVLNDINLFFDRGFGSRILVTTSDRSVADNVTTGSPYQMKFLNEIQSWDLLCRKVFAEGSCPPDLKKFGEEISEYCRGLPLAIHLVGGILLYLEKTQKTWMQVSESVGYDLDKTQKAWMQVAERFGLDAYDWHSLGNILSLSYTHLPNYLKPCFLYMAAFPEGREIRSSKLIKLWVAEGLVKPIKGMSFEKAAEKYLTELVQRSLLIVHEQDVRGEVKSYIIHDLVWHFFMKKAQEEKFLFDGKDIMKGLVKEDVLQLRLNMVNVPHDGIHHKDASKASTTISSVMLFDTSSSPDIHHEDELPWLSKSELPSLRVLDVLDVKLQMLPEGVKDLFHLRYLAASIASYSTVVSKVSRLCNLQTLILHKHQSPSGLLVVRVRELFDLPQLRHITFKGEHPLFTLGERKTVARHENLQTLSTVAIDDSFPKILEAIPNLKKLGIRISYRTPISSCIDLGGLSKLEILKCSGVHFLWSYIDFPHSTFPYFLKKLTISYINISRWPLKEISGFHFLEVFKLIHCDFENEMWRSTEGEFQSLRLLLLSKVKLREWIARMTDFRRLEHLVIKDCHELEKIPEEIGDIPTLEKIEVIGECRDSAVRSVRRIHEKQLKNGNKTLQVYHYGRRQEITEKSSTRQEDMTSVAEHPARKTSVPEITEESSIRQEDMASVAKHPAWKTSEPEITEESGSRQEDMASIAEYSVGKTFVPEITEESSTRQEDLTSVAEHPASKTSVPEITEESSRQEDIASVAEHPAWKTSVPEITEESGVRLEDKDMAKDTFMLQTKEDTVMQGLDGKKAISVTDSTQTDVQLETVASTRCIQTDNLQISFDSGVMVKISLARELSMPVDLMPHIMTTSSSKEMHNFGDDYLFSGVVSPESNLRGSQPSSGPTETCQASVGPVLDNKIIITGGSESAEMLMLDKWRQAHVVILTDKEHVSLPDNPDCPNLILLFLQRSNGITNIPPNFFDHMPALCFVDLSGTGIRALPESLYQKTKLQVLLLKNCDHLDNLPSEIKDLKTLEVLNMSGTELYELPEKIGQLSCLRDLQLSLYGPDDESEFAHLPHKLMPTGILSELNELQALSIEVHPEDHRWKNIAAEITEDLAKLNKLTYLQYYFPTVKSLESFVGKSQSWKEKRLRKFKLIVGDNVNRIVSRVPKEVETMYDKQDCCLRYVNGNVADEAIKTALEHASAFYLDHISNIQSLTEFEISNFKEITFCVVRECPTIQILIEGNESNSSAFSKLEYLGIYYLWELKHIWKDPESANNFQRLKHLTVDTCPKLAFVVSQAMVESVSNLEELVVQHCESLKEIIQEKAVEKYGGKVLPQLRKLVLRYLPKLVTLGKGLSLSENQIVTISCCPELDLKPQLNNPKRRKEWSSSCTVI